MSTSLAPAPTKPPVDFDQEVRFAVVMYGGSSLAIYINGVAQELLRLVRATAPEFSTASHVRQAHLADEELRGSERVYRRLGRILTRQGPSEKLDETNAEAANRTPIRTRFVVDILTGTSAGGINAVYLAKSLANNQDMDELKNLWVTEGDIGSLINDLKSYDKLGFTLDDPAYPGEPWSLLNSRRMHLRLLEALRQMEATRKKKRGEPACPRGESPLVDELDLFVTATDMQGRVVQLRLADKLATEYRHRNVFRFRYRGKRATDTVLHDLEPENNEFLAFAARATSAHQAAFSPVRFDDSTHVVANHALAGERLADDPILRAFYQDYLLQRAGEGKDDGTPANPDQLAAAFRRVWFVDGGTLDNKPFSFVVEQLPLRHAETFVDRKLLYIEPSPEHSERREAPDKRPQIVGNAVSGLSSLPRYETIVEDLTRLLERNRLVERLGRIMLGAEEDLLYGLNPKQERTRGQLRRAIADPVELERWLREQGPGWGNYQRLRVAEVTDDLTLLVARAARFSEESDEFQAIRQLVRDWRDRNYHAHMALDEATGQARKSQLEFLIDFDLPWAMRRIRFCLGKLNDLACLDEQAEMIAEVARHGLTWQWPQGELEREEFRVALREMRWQLNEAFLILRAGRRTLWSRDYDENPFRSAIASLELTSSDLLGLLRQPTDSDRRDEAQRMLMQELKAPDRPPTLQTRSDAVDALTNEVRAKLLGLFKAAGGKCSDAMRPPEGAAANEAPRWEMVLRETLFYYYKYFDDFDQISYPILYSTGVGEEADVIDVFRVSPEDATALIDESAQYNESGEKMQKGAVGKKVKKLAGTTLGNFGAFFERKFRINDIMWGRLDGAERVIAALLPANPELKRELTREAHREIIKEEATNRIDLARAQANKVFGSMAEEERRAKSNLSLWTNVEESLELMALKQDCESQLNTINKGASRLPGDSHWRVFLESFVSEFRPFVREYIVPTSRGMNPLDAFKNWFNAQYEEGRTFTQSATLNSAVRINRVLGDMALGYFPPNGKGSRKRKLAMWLGRHLRLFTEAAIQPDGAARRKQRARLAEYSLLSLTVLALVCFPAVLLLLSERNLWSRLFFTIVLIIITLPLALIPLLLTAGYSIVWFKLRRKLEALLLGARRN